jgi:hypothetical protein
MARIKGVTGRPKSTAVNPRLQAHPIPGWSPAMPPAAETAAEAPFDPVSVMASPEPHGDASVADPAEVAGAADLADAADLVAARTHAWTTEEQPYDRLDCPACGKVFRELPDAVGPCPACGATVDVLTCPEGVRHLMTAVEVQAFDGDWDELHGRRKRDEAERRNVLALQARRAALASYAELGVRLVELRTALGACPACVAAAGRPFRPRAAPPPPDPGLPQ